MAAVTTAVIPLSGSFFYYAAAVAMEDPASAEVAVAETTTASLLFFCSYAVADVEADAAEDSADFDPLKNRLIIQPVFLILQVPGA